ncbi:MAG: exopolysaccharide transport family protein [Pseudomonadota bacterium]
MRQLVEVMQAVPATSWRNETVRPAVSRAADTDEFDAGTLLRALARRWKWIAALALLGLALGIILPMLFLARHEATTRVLIDPRGLQVLERSAQPQAAGAEESLSVLESEARIMTSDLVLRRVIEKNNLLDDPEFNGSLRGPLSFIGDLRAGAGRAVRRFFGRPERESDDTLTALSNLRAAVNAERQPRSFVIDVVARLTDPQKAANVANWVAQEYVDSRFGARASATEKVAGSLTDRLDELKARVETAEQAVAKFKADNDIVESGDRTVDGQQLIELNTQLSQAAAGTIRAKARLEQVQRLRRTGVGQGATSEAVASPALTALRGQVAQVRRRVAALSANLLPTHPDLQRARRELNDAQAQVREELARIAQAARLDLERAEANEAALRRDLATKKKRSQDTDQKQVRLRELERNAEASRQVYQAFLVRTRELSAQQPVDNSLALVLSPAVPSDGIVGPPRALLAGLGALMGLAFGAGLALWRDASDPVLKGSDQLGRLVNRGRVSEIPQLASAIAQTDDRVLLKRRKRRDPAIVPIPAFVVNAPDSEAAAATEAATGEIMYTLQSRTHPIVVVTSHSHDEGKSTVALNLALAAAAEGQRVVLIDADMQTQNLSRLAGRTDVPGLLQVLDRPYKLTAAIHRLRNLPVGLLSAGRGTVYPQRIPNRNRISDLAYALGESFDLVVVDAGTSRRALNWMPSAGVVVLVTRKGVSDKSSVASAFEGLGGGSEAPIHTIMISD